MILYSVLVNKGGLLRVFESMEKIFEFLPKFFPLKVIYFHDEEVESLDPHRFVHIKWIEGNFKYLNSEGIEKIQNEIENKINIESVERLICDATTYKYFEKFNFKLTYDIHILERTLYKALQSDMDSINILDELKGDDSFSLMFKMGLVGINVENRLLSMADHLIVNSETSIKDLEKDYKDIVDSKKIIKVPVSSKLSFEVNDFKINKDPIFLYHGRIHPQKGIHFLIKNKWPLGKLIIKGLDRRVVSIANKSRFNYENVEFQKWDSDKEIFKELMSSVDYVLFPSLYEPYGLSLQEALALGKICICHDNDSGHNEQVVDGVNGFLVDMSQETIFHNKVNEIVHMSESDLKEISKRAKESVKITEEERLKKLSNYISSLKD